MSRAALLVTAFLALPILHLAGQAAFPLAPGTRVRVKTQPSLPADQWLIGTVVAQEGDSLRLLVTGRPAPVVLTQAGIREIEASRGRHSNAGRGALIGLGIGAGTGLVLGVKAASCGASDWICPGPAAVPVMVLVVGSLGAGLGALIGLTSRGERWDGVPLSPARVTVGPRSAGLGLSLTF